MRIEFEEKGHIYTVDGEIASLSITELLSKHGISPDYRGVSKATLKAKAKKGKEIHKDIEKFVNDKGYEPKTMEGKAFEEWAKENIDSAVAEFKCAFIYEGMIIAGALDLIGFTKDNCAFILDHKTTSKVHKESVAWQVSIGDYFLRQLSGRVINGNLFHWLGATKFICLHYVDGALKSVELEKIPDSEIERLIKCEYNNEKYERLSLVVDSELESQLVLAEQRLYEISLQEKEAKATAQKFRELLKAEMERQNILHYETTDGLLKIAYVPTIEKTVVDNKALKEKYPQIYANCTKTQTQKSHIRIIIGEEE